MKRIKRLGLAALASLALTAMVGTAAASATEKFDAESYPVQFTIGNSTAKMTLYLDNLSYYCSAPAFSGELTSRTDSLTPKSPPSTPCTIGSENTQLNWNGCTAIFHPGTKTSENKYTGSWDIGPVGCGPMTIERPGYCVYSIGAQSGDSVTYENISFGTSREVKFNPHAIWTYSSKKLKPQFLCPEGTVQENGSLTTDPWYLKATGGGGNLQKGISIKHYEPWE